MLLHGDCMDLQEKKSVLHQFLFDIHTVKFDQVQN